MNLFDNLHDQACDGDVDGFMTGVSRALDCLSRESNPLSLSVLESDPSFIRIRDLAHQDPYTFRGFKKPRGYAGDAVLLDFIYGTAPVPEGTSEIGAKILAWCQQNSVAFSAVQERRALLARQMTRAIRLNSRVQCLSVACGHLRELALVEGATMDHFTVVAMDQDPLSLDVIKATYGKTVVPMRARIDGLIGGEATMEQQFELITVAGLYDYLDSEAANRLTITLSGRLKPGGRLIISNFIDCWERGYMHYLMKWKLLYRTLEQVEAFANGLGSEFSVECGSDATNTIAYLTIDRR